MLERKDKAENIHWEDIQVSPADFRARELQLEEVSEQDVVAAAIIVPAQGGYVKAC